MGGPQGEKWYEMKFKKTKINNQSISSKQAAYKEFVGWVYRNHITYKRKKGGAWRNLK